MVTHQADAETKPAYRDLYHVAGTSREVMSYLGSYTPPAPVNKWYKVPEIPKE